MRKEWPGKQEDSEEEAGRLRDTQLWGDLLQNGGQGQARKSMNKNEDKFRKCLVHVGTGQKQC